MRYFIRFSYFGKSYHGWQRQPNAISVQQVLEETFSTLIGEMVELVAAGRTDAGVHAKEMYAHLDLETGFEEDSIVKRLNAFLPNDIAVQEIFKVAEDAHARFHATERTYEYWLVQRKDPFLVDRAYYIHQPLNLEMMNRAAALLLDFDDFECFSRSKTDVKTFICDIKEAHWQIQGELLVFTVTADRFLRNMVRAIVGTLVEVGSGKLNIEDVKTIIKSKDRGQAGASVPAKGLYLTQVTYPKSTFTFHG